MLNHECDMALVLRCEMMWPENQLHIKVEQERKKESCLPLKNQISTVEITKYKDRPKVNKPGMQKVKVGLAVIGLEV